MINHRFSPAMKTTPYSLSVTQFKMLHFQNTMRAKRSHQQRAWLITYLIVSVWLALVQPGMSYFWLIDPALHAEIDKELYGQLPDGETLPGHEHHAPHEHPASEGTTVSG